MDKLIWQRLGRAVFLFLIFIFVLYIFKITIQFTFPFIIAFVLSFFLYPIVYLIEKRLFLPRSMIIILLFLSCFLILSILSFFILSEFLQGILFIKENVTEWIHFLYDEIIFIFEEKVMPTTEKIMSFFKGLPHDQQTMIVEQLQKIIYFIPTTVIYITESIITILSKIFIFVPNFLFLNIFILLTVYFLLIDWENIQNKWREVAPKNIRKLNATIIFYLQQSIFNFMKAQVLIVSITGLCIFIGLLLLRIEHAITIAVLAMIIDLLPYIGIGLLFIPWIIYLIFTEKIQTALFLFILYIVITLVRQAVEPKILSTTIGIHPLALLFTLFVSMKIWKAAGLLIGPMILVIFYTLLKAKVFNHIFHYIKHGKI